MREQLGMGKKTVLTDGLKVHDRRILATFVSRKPESIHSLLHNL